MEFKHFERVHLPSLQVLALLIVKEFPLVT